MAISIAEKIIIYLNNKYKLIKHYSPKWGLIFSQKKKEFINSFFALKNKGFLYRVIIGLGFDLKSLKEEI